jgi:hypothetical protein
MEEDVDFYFNDQGLMVLTAAYLQKRGYCCQNKCTNCPWNFGKENIKDTPDLTINDQLDLNDSTAE